MYLLILMIYNVKEMKKKINKYLNLVNNITMSIKQTNHIK